MPSSPIRRVEKQRRWIAPEVVQISAMDCGPASLKCLLEGFGVPISYGRLREACQTDVDGTSIDTLEEIAVKLGLDAEQIMLPDDHLLLSDAFPAIVVTRLPNDLTHFVVVWRLQGRFVQVMDPSAGRRWLSIAEMRRELYIHAMPISAADWRAWAGSGVFLAVLRRRLKKLGISEKNIGGLIEAALADPGWRGIAVLDAATRMSSSLVSGGGLKRGNQVAKLLESLVESPQGRSASGVAMIATHYWSVRPAPSESEDQETLLMRGAVLVSVRGRRISEKTILSTTAIESNEDAASALSLELVAALKEKSSRAGRELFAALRADGWLAPSIVIAAMIPAVIGVMLEMLLFRGLFDLGRNLGLIEQRIGAMAALIIFSLGLLLLDLPLSAEILRIGRHLETRLRLAFLEKVPKLGDRYFRSRLISDMADRIHGSQALRTLPALGSRALRLIYELGLTTAGIIWIDPKSASVALPVAALSILVPLILQSHLTERDLKVQTHHAALSRFYLDALLGLVPARAHGAEKAIRREHESVLTEWIRANLGFLRAVIGIDAVQALVGVGLAVWLLSHHLSGASQSGDLLLLAYWSLNIPAIGQELALTAQQYPTLRNVTLRLLEPLGAPDEVAQEAASESEATVVNQTAHLTRSEHLGGVSIMMETVELRVSGHLILDGINLQIRADEHVAIVGPSGAGKSSLAGLLLGWHRPTEGKILIDGEILDHSRLERLRRETAWVDPTVQLWNRSLVENLEYGGSGASINPISTVIESADLQRVLEMLPDGLQTPLGESGGLVSGGEGQRVRLGRAMLRPGVRLVILDEPFRGLDRGQRQELLARARQLWRNVTLLCITHDIGETLGFDQVLVIETGRLIESGSPAKLARESHSRYGSLLEAEEDLRTIQWSDHIWRRLRIDHGKLHEDRRGLAKHGRI